MRTALSTASTSPHPTRIRFRWFVASLVIYFTDHVWQRLTVNSGLVASKESFCSKGKSTVTLYLEKPIGFSFVPGQYINVQVKDIDISWHPFSISDTCQAGEALERKLVILLNGARSCSVVRDATYA